jgi:hypothetical protein
MKLQRWFYEGETHLGRCDYCGGLSHPPERVLPERTDEWIAQALGTEISIVQKKNLHGRISCGWFSESKVLIAEAADYGHTLSPVFDKILELAHEEAAKRNQSQP